MPCYRLKIPFSGLLEVEVDEDTPEGAIEFAIGDEISLIPSIERCSDEIADVRIVRWRMHESIENARKNHLFGGEKCVVVEELEDGFDEDDFDYE